MNSKPLASSARAGWSSRDLTPCTRALGMSAPVPSGAAVEAVLPRHARIAAADLDDRMHPLALLPLLDELASYAIMLQEVGAQAMATLELRLDFSGVAADGDVRASAECVTSSGESRLVLATARSEAGRPLASAAAWFTLGTYPGQRTGSSGAARPTPAVAPTGLKGPFEQLFGLSRSPGGAALAAGTPSAIGWEGLPAVHGGIIGALLAMAGEQSIAGIGRSDLRIASLTIRYLRPGGDHGLQATATCQRVGRRSAHVAARCFHDPAVSIAEAQAMFVPAGTNTGRPG